MAPFRTTLTFAIALALPLAAAARVSSDTTPGVNFGSYPSFTLDVYQYTDGQLAADGFAPRTRQPLWRGQDTETIERGRIDDEKIDKRVGEVMAQIPPRPAA